MHDSPENRTGRSPQEGMRRLLPERMGHGFRMHTTRHLRHELLDAPAAARPLLYAGAGNVPSVRSKGALEAHRSHHPAAPHNSTRGWHRTSRSPPMIPRYTTPCSLALPSKCSTGHGAPGAGACLRLQQTRPADPLVIHSITLLWHQ